jgi:hypothetical protein
MLSLTKLSPPVNSSATDLVAFLAIVSAKAPLADADETEVYNLLVDAICNWSDMPVATCSEILQRFADREDGKPEEPADCEISEADEQGFNYAPETLDRFAKKYGIGRTVHGYTHTANYCATWRRLRIALLMAAADLRQSQLAARRYRARLLKAGLPTN